MSDTMPSQLGLPITLGAYCGSISTMSAPVALSRAQPLMQQGGVRQQRLVAQHGIGADLPEDQIGLLGDHGAVEPREHVGSLVAVDAAVQDRELVARGNAGPARRPAGSDTHAADELAPAPYVDEDPSATILIGFPLARSRAVRASGESNRICSAVTLQAAGRGVLAPKLGAAPSVCACAGSTARKPAAAMAQDMAWRRSTRWRYMAMRLVPVGSICYAFFPVFLSCFTARPWHRPAADGRRR